MTDLQNAEEYVQEALIPFLNRETSPADLVGLGVADLERLVRLGISTYAANMNEKALEIFDAISMLQPDFYVAHHYTGMIEEKLGHLEEASDAYTRAGTILESLPLLSADQRSMLFDITFMNARTLFALGRIAEATVYLLELRAHANELDPHIKARVEAYLENLGVKA